MTNGTTRGQGVSVTPQPLFTPEKDPVPVVQKAGWAPGPVWTGAENLAPHRDKIPRPSNLQPVAIPTELSRSTQFQVKYSRQKQCDLGYSRDFLCFWPVWFNHLNKGAAGIKFLLLNQVNFFTRIHAKFGIIFVVFCIRVPRQLVRIYRPFGRL
jgi:hypothetical protein